MFKYAIKVLEEEIEQNNYWLGRCDYSKENAELQSAITLLQKEEEK
jgi:hypothetical protein